MLDGDRISALIAGHIQELLSPAGLSEATNLAVVQTAYANGNSTRYLQSVLVRYSCYC